MPHNHIRLLIGNEIALIEDKHMFYKDTFKAKYEDGMIIYIGADNTVLELLEALESTSLFDEKRLILCHNFFNSEKYDTLLKIYKDGINALLKSLIADTNTVLIMSETKPDKRLKWYKSVMNSDIITIEEYNEMKPADAIKWLLERAKKMNMKIQKDDMEMLYKQCGAKIGIVLQEMMKLETLNMPINSDIISTFCIHLENEVIWNMLDFMHQKDYKHALEALKTLLINGESPLLIVAMLQREVRIILQIRAYIDDKLPENDMASVLQLHPFVLRKSITNAKKYSIDMIKQLYDTLLNIENGMKTGRIMLTADDMGEAIYTLERYILTN